MGPLLLLALLAQVPLARTLETPEGAREPQLAVGPPRSVRAEPTADGVTVRRLRHGRSEHEGCVHVVYGTRTAIHVSASTDSGETFGHPRKVADVGSLALGLRRGPRVAIAGDALVVTAIVGEKGGGADGDLRAWRSTDEGETWSDQGRLNEVVGSAREGLHAMAAGSKGVLFCAWIDLAQDRPRIAGARSSDLGRSWLETTVFDDSKRICPCCAPSVAFDGNGKVWATWRGVDGASRDIVVACSEDGGSSFSSPARLGTGTWKLEACPMDGGAIDLGGGRFRSIWRRAGSVYRAGVDGLERKLGDGEQPGIVLGEDGEYAAWLERRGGALLLLRPRGAEPARLDEAANDPVLATAPVFRTPVIAAWESGPLDSPRIVVARLQGSLAAAR